MRRPLYFFRSVGNFKYSAPSIDDDYSAPAQMQTTSTAEIRRGMTLNRSFRTMSCINLSSRTPTRRGEADDDGTVLSNASTVKAGTASQRRRMQLQYEMRVASSRGSCIRTRRAVTTTPPRARGAGDKVHATTSPPLTPPCTVHSEDDHHNSPRRKRQLSFWKNSVGLRNEKLSPAALLLAQEAPGVLMARPTPKCKPMLSIPMKRFLVEDFAHVDSGPSIAEF